MPNKEPSINKPSIGTSVNTATEKIIGLFIMTAGFLMGVAFVAALIPMKSSPLPTTRTPQSLPSAANEAVADWSNIAITPENTSIIFVDQCLGQAYPSLYDPDELIVDTDILDIDWNSLLTAAVSDSDLGEKLQSTILNSNVFKALTNNVVLNSVSDGTDNCDVNYKNDSHCQQLIDQKVDPKLSEQFCLSAESREQVQKMTNSNVFSCSIEDAKQFLSDEYSAAGYEEEIVNQLTKIPGISEESAQKVADKVTEQIKNTINNSSANNLQWSCYLAYTENCPAGYVCAEGKSKIKNKYTGDYVIGGYCAKDNQQVQLPALPDLQIPAKDDIKIVFDLSGDYRALLAAAGDLNRDGSEIAAIKAELDALLAGLPLEKKDRPEINIDQSIADLMNTIDKALTEKKMTPEEKAMKKALMITALFENVKKTKQTFNIFVQSLNVADTVKNNLNILLDKMISAATAVDKEQAKQNLLTYVNSLKEISKEQKEKLVELIKDSDAYNKVRIPDPIKEELVKQIQVNIANQTYRNELLALVEQLMAASKEQRTQIKNQIIAKVTTMVTDKTVRATIINQVERLVTALESIDYAAIIANINALIDGSNIPDKETVKNQLTTAILNAREIISTMRHSSNVNVKNLEEKVAVALKNVYQNKPVQSEINDINSTINSYQLTAEEKQTLLTEINTAVSNAQKQAAAIMETLQNTQLSGVYRNQIGYALYLAVEKAATIISEVDAQAKIQEIKGVINSYQLSGYYLTAAEGLAQSAAAIIKNYDYGSKIQIAQDFKTKVAAEIQNKAAEYKSSCLRNSADQNYNIGVYGWLEYKYNDYVKVKNPDYCTFNSGLNQYAVWQANCNLGYAGYNCMNGCAAGICN